MKLNPYNVARARWTEALADLNLPKYRFDQIERWLEKGVFSADEMKNLPLALRQVLSERFEFLTLKQHTVLCSKLDETRKYAFELVDGNIVEAVAMSYQDRRSICVSSQVGCRMSCHFCASTRSGLVRNLSTAELLAQVYLVEREEGRKIQNIVVMGIGEPFENYEALMSFFRFAHREHGLNIGYRHMTVSTCGLVPEMLKFSDEGLPITLALSLHAPTQKLRESIMPIAKRYGLEELMEACQQYIQRSGRRITYEYALMDGVNDSPEQAKQLLKLLRGQLCHVNLIPFNSFEEAGFHRSKPESISTFQRILQEGGLACTLRRSLGNDIMAACGQLRRQLKHDGQD